MVSLEYHGHSKDSAKPCIGYGNELGEKLSFGPTGDQSSHAWLRAHRPDIHGKIRNSGMGV